MAATRNISFLKGDYTEENRYFGNVLGMTLLNCHLGPLSSLCIISSPYKFFFPNILRISESPFTNVQHMQHEAFLSDKISTSLFVDF